MKTEIDHWFNFRPEDFYPSIIIVGSRKAFDEIADEYGSYLYYGEKWPHRMAARVVIHPVMKDEEFIIQ